MVSINVAWTDFKAFVTARSVSPQYIVVSDTYYLTAIDGLYALTCQVPAQIGAEERNTDVIDFETNFKPNGNKTLPQQSSPFAAKVLANGKKLFLREHGIQAAVGIGSTDIIFTVPYNWAKVLGLEVIGADSLDSIDLHVLDAVDGRYTFAATGTTVASAELNQFGFAVNIAKDYYNREAKFDADLYKDMQIKITYHALVAKTVGLNINLHEVK